MKGLLHEGQRAQSIEEPTFRGGSRAVAARIDSEVMVRKDSQNVTAIRSVLQVLASRDRYHVAAPVCAPSPHFSAMSLVHTRTPCGQARVLDQNNRGRHFFTTICDVLQLRLHHGQETYHSRTHASPTAACCTRTNTDAQKTKRSCTCTDIADATPPVHTHEQKQASSHCACSSSPSASRTPPCQASSRSWHQLPTARQFSLFSEPWEHRPRTAAGKPRTASRVGKGRRAARLLPPTLVAV